MANRKPRHHGDRRRTVQRGGTPAATDYRDCPICGKPVKDLLTAITHKQTALPAHFDCVHKEIQDSHELMQHEKVCYLGAGSFGILQFRNVNSPIRFVIKKRIQYEQKEKPQEWKKPLLIPS